MRAVFLAASLVFASAHASAQAPEHASVHERRAVPDLDGRAEADHTVEEALLWIPRILFMPIYLVTEYLIRLPLGELLTTAERERWDLMNFSGRQGAFNWGVAPTLFVDFGFHTGVGVYAWFNNVGWNGNDVRVRAATGGADWLRFTVLDRVRFDPRTHLVVSAVGSMRPDYIFVGFGPSQPTAERESRYGRAFIDGVIALVHRPWRASHVRVAAGITANDFYDTTYVDPPAVTISRAVEQGLYLPSLTTLPPGFAGYTAAWQRIEGSVDTREGGLEEDRGGARVEAFFEVDWDMHRPLEGRWFQYGGGAGGFWDVDAGRSVGLWIAAELATPFGSEPIPFTEYPDFGLRGRMSGFRRGWITGPSAISATLEYRYPIWAALEGFVSTAVGNAFGPEFSDFDFEALRMSYMIGLRTIGDPDHALTLQVGFGTATFAQGLDPQVFRFTVGTQEGF